MPVQYRIVPILSPPDGSEVLDANRQAFELNVPWGGALLSSAAREGIEITHVRNSGFPGNWFLRAKLPQPTQDRFGTAPEILILAVRGKVQARDLERARQEVYNASFRLDVDLLIVSDDTPDLAKRIQQFPGKWGQLIPWDISAGRSLSLLTQLEQHLPTFDLFEERDPVRGRQVIGRQDEIAGITTRIESGSAIGVFGLRKVGKTTVVRAATDLLDPISTRLSLPASSSASIEDRAEFRAAVAWLDVQRAYDRSEKRVLDLLAECLSKRLSVGGLAFSPMTSLTPLGQIEKLLKDAVRTLQVPLCLVFDEYDYLFEGSGGQPAIPGAHTLFRLLRGVAQETGRLSIVLIGRDPSFLGKPEWSGFPNPMLSGYDTTWIGPLKKGKAPELLRKLGKRVGLDVNASVAAAAQELTGGHPLLHRQYGSALLGLSRARNLGWSADCEPLIHDARSRFLERDAVGEICSEISQLLQTRYPPAHQLLRAVAGASNGVQASLDAHGGWSSKEALVLRNFGILGGEEATPTIWGVLRHYFQAPSANAREEETAPKLITIRRQPLKKKP